MLQSFKDKLGSVRLDKSALSQTSAEGGTPWGDDENRTILEAFEWYSPSDGQHWSRLRKTLPALRAAGITHIWLPPGCKASFDGSNGYDIYDLWDLGDFDQKGSRRTKWGTKEELVALCHDAHETGIGILWDAVLSHKAAGDYTQHVRAVRVDPEDRRKTIAPEEEIEAWTGFRFDGRANTHSAFQWNEAHFNGTDWNQKTQTRAIYKLLGSDGGKDWAQDVDHEKGNYDYLLCHNVDLSREDVRDEYAAWLSWMGDQLGPGLVGVRYDAAKHMSLAFMQDHLKRADRQGKQDWWMIGEYCSGNVETLTRYVDGLGGRIMLFDFPLNSHMQAAGRQEDMDLRKFWKDTLVAVRPKSSVTFVHNHDNQVRDDVDARTHVDGFFIPMAYGIILLRAHGTPQIFHGDLFGVAGPQGQAHGPTCDGKLARLTLVRSLFAHGAERLYFDDKHAAGVTREGQAGRSGVALLINIGTSSKRKRMCVGRHHAGQTWADVYGAGADVELDERGEAEFAVGAKSMSVWVDGNAAEREAVQRSEVRLWSAAGM